MLSINIASITKTMYFLNFLITLILKKTKQKKTTSISRSNLQMIIQSNFLYPVQFSCYLLSLSCSLKKQQTCLRKPFCFIYALLHRSLTLQPGNACGACICLLDKHQILQFLIKSQETTNSREH